MTIKEKEYTSVDQQLQLLEKRGVVFDDDKEKEKLKTYLLEYGYERVITSSKSIFVKEANFDDENFKYDDDDLKPIKPLNLRRVFDIDRNISSEISRYLSKSAEIKVNTIIGNKIAEIMFKCEYQRYGMVFELKDDQFKKIFSNYNWKNANPKVNLSDEDCLNELKHKLCGIKMQKDWDEENNSQNHSEYNINQVSKKYPLNENACLPIWKISNAWTLSSVIDIFKALDDKWKQEIINEVCPGFKEIGITKGEFITILNWFRVFRNKIAHNYSIFKAKYVIKYQNLVDKLTTAKIILKNEGNQQSYGLRTFVRLLEFFLNINKSENPENKEKIQKAIDKIFEDTQSDNDKNKEKIQKAIDKIFEDTHVDNDKNKEQKIKDKIKSKINW